MLKVDETNFSMLLVIINKLRERLELKFEGSVAYHNVTARQIAVHPLGFMHVAHRIANAECNCEQMLRFCDSLAFVGNCLR